VRGHVLEEEEQLTKNRGGAGNGEAKQFHARLVAPRPPRGTKQRGGGGKEERGPRQ